MNGQPHTHQVEIGKYVIGYGDTRVSICRWFGTKSTQRRYDRLIRKAIKRHDKGSQRAAKVMAKEEQQIADLKKTRQLIANSYNDRLLTKKAIRFPDTSVTYAGTISKDQWGTEVLAERQTDGS